MRYAIFSDIHGNARAFEAAAADAKNRGADVFLMIGDYANSFPWGDRVADMMRETGAVAVRGNGENYFTRLRNQNVNALKDEQFKPVYWAYRTLKRANLDYLTSLPEYRFITCNGDAIRLAHASEIFHKHAPDCFRSFYFRQLMNEKPFTHGEYLAMAKASVLSRPDVLAEIIKLPAGVYLFGHNHLQFHMEYEGRLFINPGSCGEALDYDTTAAYTILEYAGRERNVVDCRAAYDTTAVVQGMKDTGYAAYAPVWSYILELEITTGRDYFSSFVRHLAETGRKTGRTETPAPPCVWDMAVRTWDKDAY